MRRSPGRLNLVLWGLERSAQFAAAFPPLHTERMGRDSSVGTATCYRLDCPEIESRCGQDFPHPSRPTLWPTRPHIRWVAGYSRGGGGD